MAPADRHDRVRFRDRADAGRRLGEALVGDGPVDPIVLALPRGGVPVAAEVAERLGAPLEVLVARKVGAPGHPEFGIGAIAEGGVRVAGPSLERLGLDDDEFARLADEERHELERRVLAYRGGRGLPDVSGRDVVVVDDGLATGVTAEAALLAVRRLGPRRIVLAVPVGAPDTVGRLQPAADLLVCLTTPGDLVAVGRWYRTFGQVGDDEVLDLLASHGHAPDGEQNL